MLTVCCSSASCMAALSSFDILSISSIQQMPLEAKTKAPASKLQPLRNSSLTTAAVIPAPETPFPDTYLPFGAIKLTLLSIALLPEPGSPTSNICKSPLLTTLSLLTFLTPPSNCNSNDSLTLRSDSLKHRAFTGARIADKQYMQISSAYNLITSYFSYATKQLQ